MINNTSINQPTKAIDQAVSLSRSGMWRKACHILQSSGITPNNNNTWQLLKAKHPSCPTPVTPAAYTTSVSLEPDFNVISTLHSFPKDTAAGPSYLHVPQHFLDVVSIPLPHPISSLSKVTNILIAGKAPALVHM